MKMILRDVLDGEKKIELKPGEYIHVHEDNLNQWSIRIRKENNVSFIEIMGISSNTTIAVYPRAANTVHIR